MIMNLGLPYKGSKNTIANDIVKALPCGKKLLDACCGGGAILMAAAMSGRWEKVVGNDLNAATIALLDAVLIHKGQIEYEHPPVCTRDDYKRLMGAEYRPLDEGKQIDIFEGVA